MPTVLVTGATGAIGSWVTRSLVERGIRPIAFDASPDLVLLHDVTDRIDLVQGDVRDLGALTELCQTRGVDRIVHLAAWLGPQLLGADARADPRRQVEIGTAGTLNILDVARQVNVKRVVYMSSRAVFGEIDGPFGHPSYDVVPATYRKAPTEVYGATKVLGESLVDTYARLYSLSAVSVRLAIQYGPGKPGRAAGMTLLAGLVEGAVRGEVVTLPRGADEQLDLIYIRDIADGVADLVLAAELRHRVYQLGSGGRISFGAYVDAVRAAVPSTRITVGPGLDPLGIGRRYYVMDIRDTVDDTGWRPRYGIADGIRDHIDVLRRLAVARGAASS